MAKKEKQLCKWKAEEIAKKFDRYAAIVKNPKYVCQKCGRVANKNKLLHKPAAL